MKCYLNIWQYLHNTNYDWINELLRKGQVFDNWILIKACDHHKGLWQNVLVFIFAILISYVTEIITDYCQYL